MERLLYLLRVVTNLIATNDVGLPFLNRRLFTLIFNISIEFIVNFKWKKFVNGTPMKNDWNIRAIAWLLASFGLTVRFEFEIPDRISKQLKSIVWRISSIDFKGNWLCVPVFVVPFLVRMNDDHMVSIWTDTTTLRNISKAFQFFVSKILWIFCSNNRENP